MTNTTLLLGATGETGKELLKQLAASQTITKVISVGRRLVDLPGEGFDKIEQRIVDFDNLDKHEIDFKNIDKAFCCLGTTRGKAGKEGFIKVDYDYVLKSAEMLKSGECTEFHLLTSKGSNPSSWFLYPSTKGKIEEAVKGLGFNKIRIYRPGLLLCDRTENRAGEGWLRWIAGFTDKSYSWSIPTSLLARAMLLSSENCPDGISVLEHSDIVKIAEEK
ncbi:oxidoreductase HTATIP2 [Eurytemora carolleeae]|uniref:oxidoreductase HTATIP2 n=1 Tax=Eurytemora carolleeae TaxID=1294199 RepID=UPI000C75C067|nr:oxidoreductase HTATIP2 [Eurytemora carolleeae]XP_023336426.1 oxidoreductase HTATIP2 [Eurytemora carolleeae]|eukprot:XP_023336419.1 oxidoreductase HTATIP2-like [Eurytemora affinis]